MYFLLAFISHDEACLSEFSYKWRGTASNHGIKIIIDLHAAPGSQNGQEHSSSRDGIAEWAVQVGIDYIGESIKTIDFLASR